MLSKQELLLNAKGLMEGDVNECAIRERDRRACQDLEWQRSLVEDKEHYELELVKAWNQVPMAIATANIGRQMSKEEHIEALVEDFGEAFRGAITSLSNSAGADRISWLEPVTPDELVALELGVFTRLVPEALEAAEVSPSEVKYFGYASSSPGSLLSAHYMAESLGINPEAEKKLYSTACASSKRLFGDIVDTAASWDEDGWAVMAIMEDLNGLRKSVGGWIGTDDLGARVMFADKPGVVVFKPKWWNNILRVVDEVPDEERVLTAVNTVPLVWGEGSSKHIAKSRYGTVGKMPETWNGNNIEMKLKETGMLFSGVSRLAAQKLDEKMKAMGIMDWSGIDMMATHRPNKVIYGHMEKDFGRFYQLQKGLMEWNPEGLVVDNNIPAFTFLFERLRQMDRMVEIYKEKGLVTGIDVFFGAGASYDAALWAVCEPGSVEAVKTLAGMGKARVIARS
jgi:hypothetical protein